jgi:hypothetical protein
MTSCDCENTSSKFSRNLCSISSTPSTNGGIAKDNKMRKKIRCIIRHPILTNSCKKRMKHRRLNNHQK